MGRIIGRYRASLLAALAIGLGYATPSVAGPSPTSDTIGLGSPASPPASSEIPPSATIVATVDGDPIRSDDVDLVIAGIHIPDGTDRGSVVRIAVKELVEQRLLIRSVLGPTARANPALSAIERRDQLNDLLSTCGHQLAAASKPITKAEIAAYMADHPYAYAKRLIYRVDQLLVRASRDDLAHLKELEPDHTFDAVAAHLTALKIAFERGTGSLDTKDLSPDFASNIEKLPTGEPFLMVANKGDLMVYVVRGRDSIVETPEGVQHRAMLDAINVRYLALSKEHVRQARANAKITYASGFEPLPDTPTKSPTG